MSANSDIVDKARKGRTVTIVIVTTDKRDNRTNSLIKKGTLASQTSELYTAVGIGKQAMTTLIK